MEMSRIWGQWNFRNYRNSNRVLESYLNPSQSASQYAEALRLNDSITSNAEIIPQLLRIEKHAIKTGESDAGALLAQAGAIFEQKEIWRFDFHH